MLDVLGKIRFYLLSPVVVKRMEPYKSSGIRIK